MLNAPINLHTQNLDEFNRTKAALLGSYLTFTRAFFQLKTGREFKISQPIGNESHHIIIAKALKEAFNLNPEYMRLIINIPPGCNKSTMMAYFIAWTWAHYPDSNNLYISNAYDLAEKHTITIKEIIQMPEYKHYFGVELMTDSKAKGNFRTTALGCTRAFGSSGPVVGQDGGLPNLDRWSGSIIIDDAHKPDEVHSDTMREAVLNNYNQTIKMRPRGENVPIIFIGQRLHEEDLASFLISGRDGYKWKTIILPGEDYSGNARFPDVWSKERMRIERDYNPYSYHSQIQQNPQPAGGTIFKRDDFKILDLEPNIISTFITVDTAETDKTYNDASVFSFWGIYKPKILSMELDMFALHWIDCREIRVEPKDLENELLNFYAQCMTHRVKPTKVAIERKSTGVTLASSLKAIPALQIIDIERTRASGSKTTRFLECQKYVAKGQVSFTRGAPHVEGCLEQARKITANNTHSNDDRIDTMYDGIKLTLIDGTLLPQEDSQEVTKPFVNDFMQNQQLQQRMFDSWQ